MLHRICVSDDSGGPRVSTDASSFTELRRRRTGCVVSKRPPADRKAEIKATATLRRWEVVVGGVLLFGMSIPTDVATEAKLSGALQLV